MRHPDKYHSISARILHGVLLVGPPGTSKTLLARVVAGDARVPFFSTSGSKVVEIFVGFGASRIRELFKKAKEAAPAILFVYVLDAVGKRHGEGLRNVDHERKQTLNQLLVEMYGFDIASYQNIFVIVARKSNAAIRAPSLKSVVAGGSIDELDNKECNCKRRVVMSLRNWFNMFCVCTFVGIGFLPGYAHAVPSYARQTGMPCAACHTTPPELTPFGRDFKINGYVMTGMQQIEAPGKGTEAGLKISEVPPLSAMLLTSFTRTSKNQPDTQNNDTSFPQELSLFFAGEITPHIGSFLQLTYTQENDNLSLDNTDIRYANHTSVAGKQTIYGVTLNNSPTVEDPWNTTPVWGYPFLTSDVAPSPAAAPLISDALAQQVAGLGGYTFWNDHLYADVSLYRSAHLLGEGQGGAPGSNSEDTIKNVTPYWRLAWEQNVGSNSLEVGTFGLWSELYPQGISGKTDKYTDLALDSQLEHPMGDDMLTLRGTYIHQNASLDGSVQDGLAASDSNNLDTLNLNGTYHLGTSAAFSIGGFNVSGDSDKLLYAPDPLNGSANGSPDSRGYILQATYLPWQNTQFTLQYVGYNKFNGSSHNYDGSGRDASDNNTIYLAAWLVW